MPGGQSLTSARGTVTYGLTLALVGIVMTASSGTVTATGDNAVGLSGHSATSAQGTLTQSASAQLTGRVAIFTQGQLFPNGRSLVATSTGTTIPNLQISLTGQAVASEQGTATGVADGTLTLTGRLAAFLGVFGGGPQGTVLPASTQALTGSAVTSASGTLAPRHTPLTSTGQALSVVDGVLAASGPTSVTAHLSGTESTFSQGVVDATPALTGMASTTGIGTVTYSLAVPLVGTSLTASQGPTIVEQNPDDLFIQSQQGATALTMTVPLTGTALSGAQGTITLNDGEQGLTGSVSTSVVGSVGFTVDCLLSGQAVVTALESMGAPGYATLSGQAITSAHGNVFLTTDRTQSLSGLALTAGSGNLTVNPRPLLVSQLLNSASGQMGRMGGSMEQALSGQSLTSHHGSVGVIGQSPTQPTPSLEGCGITSGVAVESVESSKTASSEGCFITSGSANEVA
jgi:hypothetical protein